MRTKVTLITGASGEVGQALIENLLRFGANKLLTVDVRPLSRRFNNSPKAITHIEGDVLDADLFARLVTKYEFEVVYHLAALEVNQAEFSMEMAHDVNVNGTIKLMQLVAEQSAWCHQSIRFIYPSSIAVFGPSDLITKSAVENVREWDSNFPTTVYGCNQLYCELLGNYFSRHYQQMAEEQPITLDFRCIRLPELVNVIPTHMGRVNSYPLEMVRAAIKGEPYTCAIREDTYLPFMAMPDAIKALTNLAAAQKQVLRRCVYNVASFSLAPSQIYELVLAAFPHAEIHFESNPKYQAIMDSWPATLDDSAARRDWGWQPDYDMHRTFHDYLISNVVKRYQVKG